jgi:SNF2 family DNA or RNA helicase
MAVDRQLKKKRKRRKQQKEGLRLKDRALRYEKVEKVAWEAATAYREENYQEASDQAMKGLKLVPNHPGCYHYAWMAANQSQERDSLFSVLQHGWEHNLIEDRQHLYVLGCMAYDRSKYALAQEVFHALIENPQDIPQGAKSLQREINQARKYLKSCETLQRRQSSVKTLAAPQQQKKNAVKSPPSSQKPAEEAEPPASKSSESEEEPLPELEVVHDIDPTALLNVVEERRVSDPEQLNFILKAYKLSFRTSYDQLLCLSTLHDVESLWYQEETTRKVLKTFRGRAILADEVGLGKTIEASLILKEYILRGLVKSALILVPSSLVNQWHAELYEKFGLTFASSNDALFRDDPTRFWEQPFLLVSLQTARMKRHFDTVTARSYDMLIVDEAHHLKNRTTRNWKLVNAIQKTFLLLLTATPVQNKLEELYNLVTLLKPGHLKTLKAFKAEFVARGNPTDPRNREKLRELLKEVMVRNTRSVAQLRLPPRFASTVQVSPTPPEAEFYEGISQFVAQQSANGAKGLSRMLLRSLLEAAGSSHFAALKMLENMSGGGQAAEDLLKLGRRISTSGKLQRVIELLKSSTDQKVVFVNYLRTLDYLHQTLKEQRIPHVVFRGGMTPKKKHEVIETFRGECPVLLATESGGEGHNLQFCHTMINYDLPWNPMRIEQRIGRIHRFGQQHNVQVYNFCANGSIEDHILTILDRKINMFELVVGEIDMILGRLRGEQEFSELVYDLWVSHTDEAERDKAFSSLGTRIKRAKTAYEKSRELDDKLFQENFGV